MSKLTYGLSALLLVQLLVGEALYWNHQQKKHDAVDVQQALLIPDADQIDKITIQEGGKRLTLQKTGDHWQLPDTQLPVDQAKMDGLMTKFSTLNGGWPVATTASSHERFEVAENKYQRHVILYQGETSKAELYVGNSPGFRKAHVRKAGSDAVYAAQLNTFELPTLADDWLDKTLLASKGVKRIQGSDYVLEKQQENWSLVSPVNSELNQQKAKDLVAAFESLRVTGRIERAVDETNSGTQTAVIQITNDTNELSYSFIQLGGNYVVKRSDVDHYFSLAEADYQRITAQTAAQLQAASPPADEAQGVPADQGTDAETGPASELDFKENAPLPQ